MAERRQHCSAEWGQHCTEEWGNEDPSEIEKLSGDASAGQLLSCTVHTLNSCLFVCFCGLFVCLFLCWLVPAGALYAMVH